MECLAELAEPNLRALVDDGDVLDPERGAALGHDDRVLDVLDVSDLAHFANVDLLQPGLDEAAPSIGIVTGQLLLHLPDAESVGDEFVRVEPDLIFASRAAERVGIGNAGD